jgi:hypothetical protein
VVKVASIMGEAQARPIWDESGEITYFSDEDVVRIAAILHKLARKDEVPQGERQWLEHGFSQPLSSGSGRSVIQGPGADAPSPEPKGPRPARAKPLLQKPDSEEAEPPDRDSTNAELLSLDAAGTVLVHPFIAKLFGACGLLDGQGAFPGDTAQERGVLLLHFAATGECEVAEPELTLAKLLCGAGLALSIPRAFEPSETERTEVDAMLDAAIAHWGAIGNTSSAALRETFLKRPGLLRRDGEQWKLLVEQRGVDVLLDRLPWTIGIVQTPFMTRPLRVDWR